MSFATADRIWFLTNSQTGGMSAIAHATLACSASEIVTQLSAIAAL